jgi:Partial alpha/beta-hydrolase lipase region
VILVSHFAIKRFANARQLGCQMTTSSVPASLTLGPLERQVKLPIEASPTSTDTSSNSPLHEHVNRERSNVGNSAHPLVDRSNTTTPKHADETVSNPLFPLPSHYTFLSIQIYRLLSMFLSVGFLIFVMLCAMAKTVPSVVWVLWSWCRFKDPDRFRPFYQQEKGRKHIKTGKLKSDIGYYAQRVGLDCEEFKVETEDGFLLTIQHIIDPKSGSVDPKSNNFLRVELMIREVSCTVVTWTNAIVWSLLCQRRVVIGILSLQKWIRCVVRK